MVVIFTFGMTSPKERAVSRVGIIADLLAAEPPPRHPKLEPFPDLSRPVGLRVVRRDGFADGLGKLTAEKTLEIYNSAEIKGSFTANLLIIPAGQRFRWPDALQLGGADIAGELVASIRAKQTVTLRSTAKFFGDVEAGGLVIEPGAVFVGQAKIKSGA